MVAQTTAEALRLSSTRYLWMHNRDWISMAEHGEPMIAVEGKGVRITDADGRSYIDVNGGYNSVNVGYGRTEITDAAFEQMNRISYFPFGTTTEPTAMLAQKLAQMTPGSLSRAFPVSGGSEANETAIKIALAYHRRRGDTRRYKIISRMGSYHGTTAGVLFLGGYADTQREDFEPAPPGMVYAPPPSAYHSPIPGETDSEARGGRLRKRPVPDPVLAELLAEAPVHPESPAVDADVLAQQDDVRIAAHFFPNRFVDGL